MDVEYNRCWNLHKFFNRLGHKSVILCLWLIRINGGLPYRWRHAESVFDQKTEPWGVEAKGRKAPFLLIRRPVLVAWSSVNAIIVCATFIVYVVFFVLPKFELLKSTEATAVLLKNLVEFMVAIGLVCYLRVKEGLLARLVCVMYGFGKPFGVPRTMDRSWMQMASAVIVKASLLSAFVIVAQNYRSDDTLYSKVDVAFSFIIRIVMSMSVLPVLLLLHYITLMMAVWYNDVYCSFQRHALDLIPTKNIREMVVTEQEAVQLSEGQPPQLSPSMNKAKKVPSSFPQPSLESPIMHVAETSIHVVYKLQHLQRLLNNYYSIPVLLVMTRSITNLVFLFFLVVMNPKNRSFFISMEALQEVASIVLMCLASETVAKQVRWSWRGVASGRHDHGETGRASQCVCVCVCVCVEVVAVVVGHIISSY
ncbi:uncharacterized protein LOC126999377 [Eriocheir sinensis]|uniref:uncharacterized protein LOC126999377 n=1 Tax=Eriocheir sinensis TaxID=95602 RepID=UPI0021C64DDF|nr:uncharacterized protein LOC126999377 [Eriocheir sinensis]